MREKLSAESKKKSNEGALVGQEALDALDGIGEDKRSSRKDMASIRRRKVGTSGKKTRSSKSATGKKRVEKAVLAEIADSDDSDEEYAQEDDNVVMEDVNEAEDEEGRYESDDSEDDTPTSNRGGRPKRSIQKPSRYTR